MTSASWSATAHTTLTTAARSCPTHSAGTGRGPAPRSEDSVVAASRSEFGRAWASTGFAAVEHFESGRGIVGRELINAEPGGLGQFPGTVDVGGVDEQPGGVQAIDIEDAQLGEAGVYDVEAAKGRVVLDDLTVEACRHPRLLLGREQTGRDTRRAPLDLRDSMRVVASHLHPVRYASLLDRADHAIDQSLGR